MLKVKSSWRHQLKLQSLKKKRQRPIKLADASEKKLDSTTLQIKEMERLAAEREAKRAEKENKKMEQWNDNKKKMDFRLLSEPISDLMWSVNDRELNLTVYRGSSPFNFNVIRNAKVSMFGYQEWVEMLEVLKRKRNSKIITDLMEALERRFQWVKNMEKRFGVDTSKPVAEQTPAAESNKKRKRASGDGVEKRVLIPLGEGLVARNLTVLRGVKFREGMVIRDPEFGMCFTNNAIKECSRE